MMGTETLKEVDRVLEQYPRAGRDALIPILQDVQEACGYLSRDAITRIGAHLRLPSSKVYGVAMFYNQFRFQPTGRFHIQVCRGTACHVKGSAGVLASMQQELKVDPGQTTRDGLFSLEVVACIGACGLAPVICINGEFYADMSPVKVHALLEEYRERAKSHDKSAN